MLEELHAHVDGVGNPNPLLLTGPAGSGKSTTLATLVSEIQSKAVGRVAATPSALEATPSASGSGGPESAPEPFVLLHTFGLMGRSDDIRRVLLRLCAELKQRFNIYVDLPDTLREVAGALPRFLAHAALFGKVVFILDGLDRAEMHGLELHDYLPAALPLAVRVIVSSAGCKALNDAKDQLSKLAKVVQLPPLGHQERVGVLNSSLATVAGGQIHVNEMLEGLVAKEDAGSPLYLVAAVNEIKARVRVRTRARARGRPRTRARPRTRTRVRARTKSRFTTRTRTRNLPYFVRGASWMSSGQLLEPCERA